MINVRTAPFGRKTISNIYDINMNNYINIRKLTEMMAKVALKRASSSIRIIAPPKLTVGKMNGKLFIK